MVIVVVIAIAIVIVVLLLAFGPVLGANSLEEVIGVREAPREVAFVTEVEV